MVEVLETPLGDATPVSEADNANLLHSLLNERIGRVYNLAGYGNLATGAGFGAAVDAAIAAITASGNPGIIEIPDGQYTDSVGNHTLPKNSTVRGQGSVGCMVVHSANNTWMTGLDNDDNILGARWQWEGFTLTGNTGASAKGIVFGNCYRPHFKDVVIQDYTAGVGTEIRNSTHWTEGTLFQLVNWRNNAICCQTTQSGTGTNSLAETRFDACSMAITGSQVGLDIADGMIMYGGRMDIKFNAESVTSSAVCIRTGDDVEMRNMTWEVEGETDGDPIGVQAGDGSFLHGPGRLDLWRLSSVRMRNDLTGTARIAIGSGNGSWAVVDTHLGEATAAIKTLRTVISADGEVALVWHPDRLSCRVTMEFVGNNRRDTQTYEVIMGDLDFNNPVITRIGNRYSHGGQKVFSNPGLRVIDGVGDMPTLVTTIGNRNGASGILTVVVEAKGGSVWPSDLHVLEGEPGTMTASIFYGTGWEASGVATVADGGTIAHGLPVAPTVITVTGSVAGEIISATADATNITVAIKTHAGAAGTSQAISWRVSKS